MSTTSVGKRESITVRQAVEQALAQMDGPIAMDEFSQRVLDIRPSTAKNPLATLRDRLRVDHRGKTLVFLDAQTILPLRIALHGVRFRIPIARLEADQGILFVNPAFAHFLRRDINPAAVRLLDQQGNPLPVRLVTLQEQVTSRFGQYTHERPAFDLGDWFRAHQVRCGDSVLVTIQDWEAGCFCLEHEPADRCRKKEVAQKDQELADLFFAMLEAASIEQIFAFEAVPTAHARLSDPRGYPGNHWVEVIGSDPRLTYAAPFICYSEFRSPLERILLGASATKKPFSPAQDRMVYRFKAALVNCPGLWCTIEIRGKQTLGEFDTILRAAFDHDSNDHLSGFWKLSRRGKGKRFRKVELGDVNPFEQTEGSARRIASLELQPSDELKYVYDFGDWIEHRITLEATVEPEKGTKYPRIVAQNQPRR